MRSPCRLALVLLALGSTASLAEAQWWDEVQHTSIHLGQRFLDNDSFWEPLDEPFVVGFEYDAHSLSSGLGFEVGFFFSFDSEDNVSGTGIDADQFFFESDLGARYTLDVDRFHPYVGGGLAVVYADITAELGGFEDHEDEWTVGGYAHAGAYFDVAESLSLGVDVRGLFGTDVDFGTPLDGDVDYVQVVGTIGWSP